MARRARKSAANWWVFAVVLLVLAAFVGAVFFVGGESSPYRTSPELDIPGYLESSGGLRGNVYRLEGEVMNLLARSPASGRLIAVGVGEEVLPLLVTPNFNHLNVQRGQRFQFLIEVDENGLLRTKDLTKS
jgi:hypothetical protein